MRTHTLLLVVLLTALSFGSGVRAQTGSEEFGEPPPPEPATAGKPRSAAQGTGEVSLSVRALGVGSRARAGEWTGIQLEVTDSHDKPRAVLVRLAIPDADGDTALLQRTITTNPNQKQSLWLYARLPSNFQSTGETLLITAHEAGDAGTDSAGRRVYSAGKLLGSTNYLVNQPLDYGRAFMAVMGTAGAGLEQYTWPMTASGGTHSLTGHESVEVVGGLGIPNLPDRWMGLSAFEVLLWTGNDPILHQPGRLSGEQASAIREWVERGGHLIVVLPQIGESWYGTAGGASGGVLLRDILPVAKIKRREGVSLQDYRSLLTRDRRVTMPEGVVVQSFEPDNAGPQEFVPVMTGPAGEVVVVRRIVGAGAVTLVGIDIASQKLHGTNLLMQADLFWNRLLGRWQVLPTTMTLNEQYRGGKDGQQRRWTAQPQPLVFDQAIPGLVSKSGSAAAGVLLALGVFALYWLLAGPLGFFALKKRGLIQHAWVAFGAAIALFTAIAWGGANALKIRRVEGQHLTMLDIVYGQPMQRARSWISLFLPNYGEQRVSVASDNEQVRNAIAPWEPPPAAGGAGFSAFPDARGYVVESRGPESIAFPSRATVKQVQVDWMGNVPAGWGLPLPAAAGNVQVGEEIRITARDPLVEPKPNERSWQISGTLTHSLPKGLTDVHIVLVRGPLRGLSPASMLQAEAYASKPAGLEEWKAGQALVLNDCFALNLRELGADGWLERLRGQASRFGGGVTQTQRDWQELLMALSLFNVLAPPRDSDQDYRILARRQSTHLCEISRWMTQPCLIVMGIMSESELPISLSVDSLKPDAVRARVKGRTLVRWVYPLAPSPTQAVITSPDTAEGGVGAPGGTAGGGEAGATGAKP